LNTRTKTQLTPAEELEYIKNYHKNGNNYHLNKLIENNLGLVHKIVSKFPLKSASCSYEDLFNEGVLGLRHAIIKFEVERGYKLSTYSYNWITAYVRRYWQNHAKTIRVPVHMSEKQLNLNKEVEALQRELGGVPTDEAIAERVPNADAIRATMLDSVSLNQLVNDEQELEGVCGIDNTEENDNRIDVGLLLDKLKTQVSERDFNILVKRYGLDNKGVRTLREISDETGLTRARIHQIEAKLMRDLRKLTNAQG